MERRKELAKKIKRGKVSEEELSLFLEETAKLFYQRCLVNFALNYYDFLPDEKGYESFGYGEKADGRIHAFAEKMFLSREDGDGKELLSAEIGAFRQEICDRADALSGYAEAFRIFEFAVSKRGFSKREEASDSDEEAREILRFIFEEEDNFLINLRVKEMIKRLPLRYTRGKFLELLDHAFDKYVGMEHLSFDAFAYKVKQAGLIYETEAMHSPFREFYKEKEDVMGTDLGKLSEEEAEVLGERISKLRKKAEGLLQEELRRIGPVNELYCSALLKEHFRVTDEKAAMSAIRAVHEVAKGKGEISGEDSRKIDRAYEALEGKPELLYEEIEEFEEVLEMIEKGIGLFERDLSESPEVQVLVHCQLLAKSDFVNLSNHKNSNLPTEKKEIEVVKKEISESFTELFRRVKPLLRKTVMAEVLGELPVFFDHRTEIMEYVRSALSRCESKTELRASLASIDEFRRENDFR